MSTQTVKQGLFQLSLFAVLSCRSSQPSIAPESLFDNQQAIWNCHHKETWSQEKVATQLIGRWQWRYLSCESSFISATQNAGLAIIFKPNKTLTVWQNGVAKQTARWEVVRTDQIWGLKVQPSVSQLYGRILFCAKPSSSTTAISTVATIILFGINGQSSRRTT